MSKIRTIVCVLIALSFVTALPLAAAEDDPGTTLGPLEGKCVTVSPFDFPPVSVYDCPDRTDP